jgi:predicted ester cyclase
MGNIVIEGNYSASHWTFEGTQTGVSPTTGAAPTGRKIKFTGCTMSRLENGKIVEEWEHGDYLGVYQQLGLIDKLW